MKIKFKKASDEKLQKMADNSWEKTWRPNFLDQTFPKRIARIIKTLPDLEEASLDVCLYIYGSPGFGKTILACQIMLVYFKRWYYTSFEENSNIFRPSCVFYNVEKLMEDVKMTYTKDSPISKRTLIKPLIDCDLLILDDLFADRETEDNDFTLQNIIAERYENDSITIYTSNVPLNMDRYDQRIVRRLLETCDVVYKEKRWNEKD